MADDRVPVYAGGGLDWGAAAYGGRAWVQGGFHLRSDEDARRLYELLKEAIAKLVVEIPDDK